jgi:7 transmembrane receptor (rhodopsin family)
MTSGSVGLTLNVLVLIVIATYRPMRQRLTNAFIANLAAIDAVAALFLILHHTIEYNPSYPLNPNYAYDQLVCKLWYSKAWLWSMLTSSSYGIVALTLERYMGIVHPLWHKTFFTRPKVRD